MSARARTMRWWTANIQKLFTEVRKYFIFNFLILFCSLLWRHRVRKHDVSFSYSSENFGTLKNGGNEKIVSRGRTHSIFFRFFAIDVHMN